VAEENDLPWVRLCSPQVETAEPALSEVERDVDEVADFDASCGCQAATRPLEWVETDTRKPVSAA